MIQYSNLNRVMDVGDHFKNGARQANRLMILFILNVFLLSGCGKSEMDNNSDIDDYITVTHDYRVQDVLYAKGSKLKQISKKYGGETWYLDSEYEYDDLGRISKISHPMYDNGSIIGVIDYEDYVYNDKNQLEEIIYYNNNLSYKYSYDSDGNKIKEVISSAEPGSTLYYYNNNRLTREEQYIRNIFIAYTEYEYDAHGNLFKETAYSGTDNILLRYSVHSYQDGLNVKTSVFIYYNVIGKTPLREILRYYDENDNLIYVQSNELSILSSYMSYFSKYEYD